MDAEQQVVNGIELWKMIHGGCWPGPQVDPRITGAVQEVVAALALHNFSNAFANDSVGKQLRAVAVESLDLAIPALQKAVRY